MQVVFVLEDASIFDEEFAPIIHRKIWLNLSQWVALSCFMDSCYGLGCYAQYRQFSISFISKLCLPSTKEKKGDEAVFKFVFGLVIWPSWMDYGLDV